MPFERTHEQSLPLSGAYSDRQSASNCHFGFPSPKIDHGGVRDRRGRLPAMSFLRLGHNLRRHTRRGAFFSLVFRLSEPWDFRFASEEAAKQRGTAADQARTGSKGSRPASGDALKAAAKIAAHFQERLGAIQLIHPPPVTGALDPRVHILCETMDCRAKPGNEGWMKYLQPTHWRLSPRSRRATFTRHRRTPTVFRRSTRARLPPFTSPPTAPQTAVLGVGCFLRGAQTRRSCDLTTLQLSRCKPHVSGHRAPAGSRDCSAACRLRSRP